MLIRHLAYFVTLAKERHFARAADACHITQPTLSAAIRKLEEDLGVPLVARGHRFTGLTPEGEQLLAWSRQILTVYQSLINDLAGTRPGPVGELRERQSVVEGKSGSVSVDIGGRRRIKKK